MIACVSPSDADAEETLSTLRYAARARCIKNKPVINEDPKDALLRQYQLELQRLKKLLESNDQTIVKEIISSAKDETDDEEARRQREYAEEVERLKKECEDSNLSAQKLREELEALKIHYEAGATKTISPKPVPPPTMDEQDLEREERRRKKREAAMQEVLKRLEKLTIGGEEQGNTELRRRREKRRKKLEALASALESSAQEGNGSVFQVYGQLRFVLQSNKFNNHPEKSKNVLLQVNGRRFEADGEAREATGSGSRRSSSFLGRRTTRSFTKRITHLADMRLDGSSSSTGLPVARRRCCQGSCHMVRRVGTLEVTGCLLPAHTASATFLGTKGQYALHHCAFQA